MSETKVTLVLDADVKRAITKLTRAIDAQTKALDRATRNAQPHEVRNATRLTEPAKDEPHTLGAETMDEISPEVQQHYATGLNIVHPGMVDGAYPIPVHEINRIAMGSALR